MEYIGLGKYSREHALNTRREQIGYSQLVLAENFKKYDLMKCNLTYLLQAYVVALIDYQNFLQKLLDHGYTSKDPYVIRALARIAVASRYKEGLKRRMKKAQDRYYETRDRNVDAISLWRLEVDELEAWLSRPVYDMGWVWGRDEPSDGEEEDGVFKYTRPLEVWDEYNVNIYEDFI